MPGGTRFNLRTAHASFGPLLTAPEIRAECSLLFDCRLRGRRGRLARLPTPPNLGVALAFIQPTLQALIQTKDEKLSRRA